MRPTPDARVSAPLAWDEVPGCDPANFTLVTMPKRFAELGDTHAGIDAAAGSLESLLELSAEQERGGLGDAPWPPHYRKQAGEPARVQPSKARAAKHPLITIGHAKRKEDALAGLERWKARHPDVVPHLEAADILVDSTGAAHQPGPGSGSICSTCRLSSGRLRSRWTRTRRPCAAPRPAASRDSEKFRLRPFVRSNLSES